MITVRVIHPESRAMNPWTTSERINSVILLMPDPLQPLQWWNADAIHNCDTSGKSPCDNFSPRPMASKAGLGSNSPIMSNPWIFETQITKTLLWKKQDGIPVACVGLCDDLGQMIFWPNSWQNVQQLRTIIFIKIMMTTTLTIGIWRLLLNKIMWHEESTGTLNLIPRQKDSIFSLCLLSFSPSGHSKFFLEAYIPNYPHQHPKRFSKPAAPPAYVHQRHLSSMPCRLAQLLLLLMFLNQMKAFQRSSIHGWTTILKQSQCNACESTTSNMSTSSDTRRDSLTRFVESSLRCMSLAAV